MTYEELLERINELEKENISLKNQLREQANERVTSNDDFRYEYIDDDYEENNEDIVFDPIVATPVTDVSSKSENSSVSESKVDERNFGSELRKRLFPWLRKKNLSRISNDLDYDNNQIEDEVVDINQFADAGKKDSNSEEELSAEETPVDLSDFSFVDINEDEENLENNEERENAGEEEFTGYVFVDEDTNENEEEDNKKRRFPFFGNKKEKIDYQPKHLRQTKKLERIRESKFFNKIKSAMNNKAVKVIAAVLIAPVAIGGMILAAKLSNDDNKNNSDSNPAYVMRDDSEVPSTTAANEFGVSATEVADSLDKNNKDNDKKTESNSNSKENISSSTTSGSNEQKSDQEDSVQEYNVPESTNDEIEDNVQEYDAPKSTNDEIEDNVQEYDAPESTNDEVEVDSNEYEDTKEDNVQEYNAPKSTNDEVEYNNSNDLNTDYTIVDDGYGVEIDYGIGDSVNFNGPYLYRTSVDAANDTNRYNPLYPSTDERQISLIRLVSPDGSEKITIDTNNKEKKEQLESQGWTVESYNINNLTNGVINEGWTPGKSLK